MCELEFENHCFLGPIGTWTCLACRDPSSLGFFLHFFCVTFFLDCVDCIILLFSLCITYM